MADPKSLHRFARDFGSSAIAYAIALAVYGFAANSAAAEAIKIGFVKSISAGPVFIAQEKGYFAAEGVPAELVFFDAAQPIAVATVAGAIDFGVTAPTGGFFSLAGQGSLRIIAGSTREVPGFHYFAYLASRHAYEAGLKSAQDLAGHSVAIAQIGSAQNYMLGLLA